MRRSPTWILALVAVLAMLAGGWYALRPRETLTIITVLQRADEDFPVAASIDDGIQLALEEVGHRAGRYRLVLASRNTQTSFDTYLGVEEAAEEAVKNPQVVALIGPSHYHSRTIAARLNRAGVLMLGPDDRMAELTKPGFGYSTLSPECYRPSGELNFFRVIPDDEVLERGCAEWVRKARSAVMLSDSLSDAQNDAFQRSALHLGMTCGMVNSPYRGEALAAILDQDPDVVYLRDRSVHVWLEILSAARGLGWSGRIVVRGDQIHNVELPEGMVVVSRAAPPAEFSAKFAGRFKRPADPAAWYGYQSARTIVDAIDVVNTKDRNEIRRAVARLGTFDAHGDTLSNRLEVSVVREGRLVVASSFVPSPRPPDRPKPHLTLSFHGTFRWQGSVASNDMTFHDMRGTFYIDPAKIDEIGFIETWALDNLRKEGHEIIEGVPPPGVEGRPGRTLQELQAIVDRASTEGKVVELLFGPEEPNSREDFRELCKYIHQKGFVVIPAREARK